jgi:hypothetical protein
LGSPLAARPSGARAGDGNPIGKYIKDAERAGDTELGDCRKVFYRLSGAGEELLGIFGELEQPNPQRT